MTNEKLQATIKSKNENLEYQAVQRVSQIIDEIASAQRQIRDCEKDIETLRLELKSFEIPQIDAIKILG